MNKLERFQIALHAVLDGCTLEPERSAALLSRILLTLKEEGFLRG